ncbi:alpha/beta fold hydrolase [Vitiosangium sp. GDMCC 1.1324]|uniref:alpha/beta fold hydrolase n=1 Tax=Vitiosangium sp. (strain GDMCC 1.1324) TaxID=2138576 RepID=UPI000D37D0F2|nr:alpha/beta hydrolase [Vitiosangium sp. GDMCC 1.1324]PTL75516.1 alpha/beta hydrolase [Vitiosangium sp. GDMCC 1.1324]
MREASLSVTSWGQGDPVLALHSGGMSSRQWRKLGERLASAYRVFAPDFLGSGDNPLWPDDKPFDFSQDVEAIAALLESLPRSAHLVGHSYGGLIALTLARKYPDRVRSVAVFDPVAFGVLHRASDAEGLADLARASENRPEFQDEARGGGDAWMQAFVDYWNGEGSWRAMPAPSRESFLRVGRKVFQEVRSLMLDRTAAEDYAQVTGPALLLYGEKSPAAARRVVTVLARALPSATLVEVPGAGHMGPITHPGLVNERIAEHLARAP